jgi:universal stress protein A|uniref:Universal stress protein n=1 Tax=Desulfomonile tiedjei TaxID=2358 RepID=A0A7C4EY00_9BACT
MLPKTILFATDFSENSTEARQYAMEFAQAFGAELIVLHVVNSSTIGYPSLERGVPIDIQSILATIQESVDKSLQILAKECADKGLKVQAISRLGFPAQEIVRVAQERAAGLIVMGTHGWTGFKHLILGSTAENVVRTAACPVLTVRSPKDRGRGDSQR